MTMAPAPPNYHIITISQLPYITTITNDIITLHHGIVVCAT